MGAGKRKPVLKELLFSPQNITEYHKSYDYVEPLRKDAKPVLTVETPWEVQKGIQWASIVRSRVDGKYRLWYQSGFRRKPVQGATVVDNTTHFPWRKVVCYAESGDGSTWTRPVLDRFLGDVFPGNNIVLDWDGFLLDSPSVIEDVADPDPTRRYKMLVFHQDNDDPSVTGGCLFTSPDGIDFRFTGHVFATQDAECLWYDPIHRRYLAFLKERYGENRDADAELQLRLHQLERAPHPLQARLRRQQGHQLLPAVGVHAERTLHGVPERL